jgi:hypothetical protein
MLLIPEIIQHRNITSFISASKTNLNSLSVNKTSTTMTNPTDLQFTDFPNLPPELRITIWELCLPQRIIPLSILALAHDSHGRDGHSPDTDDTRPGITTLLRRTLAEPRGCRVAEVCREARRVVLSRRWNAVGQLGLPWLDADVGSGSEDSRSVSVSRTGSWFDPRTDTLLVDCDVFGRYRGLWAELQDKLDLGSRSVVGRRAGVRVGFGMGLAGGEQKHREWHAGASANGDYGNAGFGSRIRQQTWPVVVDETVLDLTPAEAGRVGIFGLFGEERALLVELSGDPRLELLRGLPTLGRIVGFEWMVEGALNRWRKLEESDQLRRLGRELGLEGCERSRQGFGPYPVIKVELVGRLGIPRTELRRVQGLE